MSEANISVNTAPLKEVRPHVEVLQWLARGSLKQNLLGVDYIVSSTNQDRVENWQHQLKQLWQQTELRKGKYYCLGNCARKLPKRLRLNSKTTTITAACNSMGYILTPLAHASCSTWGDPKTALAPLIKGGVPHRLAKRYKSLKI